MANSDYPQSRQYQTVARAIAYIRANARQQPELDDIATAIGLSPSHLQRTFREWAGISPKRFLQFLTKEHAKAALRDSTDTITTALQSGLSGPGRLHDLMIACEAMTPGEIGRQGSGVDIRFGMADSPFGHLMVAWTERGICNLAFQDHCDDSAGSQLAIEWPGAVITQDDTAAARLARRIFAPATDDGELRLLLRGTNFQIKVWEALLQIGSSCLVSYQTLASKAGSPNASRAVGSAVAANRIAFLIPCHRVIRADGDLGNFRWGESRKAALQAWEAARLDQ